MRSKTPPSLTPHQLADIFRVLGLTARSQQVFTGVNWRTVDNYLKGKTRPPEVFARLMRYALLDQEILEHFCFSGQLPTDYCIKNTVIRREIIEPKLPLVFPEQNGEAVPVFDELD